MSQKESSVFTMGFQICNYVNIFINQIEYEFWKGYFFDKNLKYLNVLISFLLSYFLCHYFYLNKFMNNINFWGL